MGYERDGSTMPSASSQEKTTRFTLPTGLPLPALITAPAHVA